MAKTITTLMGTRAHLSIYNFDNTNYYLSQPSTSI